jgi:rSAM/selenodomain-associated transferase 2
MLISIIIPAYNEAENINNLISHLTRYKTGDVAEIIVADGGSTDSTLQLAKAAGAKAILSPAKGRANQMNFGASVAVGSILYFVHADTLPPATYATDIFEAINNGFDCGRFTTRFNSNSWLLKLNAICTGLDLFICYGGDQSFFINAQLFKNSGGYAPVKIMEEYEFVQRIRKAGARYKIINKPVLISARKIKKNGWLTVQKANYTAVKMYKKGCADTEIAAYYKQVLKS